VSIASLRSEASTGHAIARARSGAQFSESELYEIRPSLSMPRQRHYACPRRFSKRRKTRLSAIIPRIYGSCREHCLLTLCAIRAHRAHEAAATTKGHIM
jgi:hypothetical protein